MLAWDSDDESVGDMTRVSDALGGVHVANADTNHVKEEDDIDEMELLQLRNLVQQIKLQTVIGDNFMKGENKGLDHMTNPLDSLVNPITEEDVEAKYKQLMADHTDLLEERDQLNARINQFKMKGGGPGEEGDTVERLRRERDVAKRETQAAKLEVDNLKICQRNLKQFYQDKFNELGMSEGKTSDGSGSVPLEDYNKLKELHFALNLQHQESEQRIHHTQENLHESCKARLALEKEIKALRYENMGMSNQPSNGFNRNSQNGNGNPSWQVPIWQQMHHNNQQMPGSMSNGGGDSGAPIGGFVADGDGGRFYEMMIPGSRAGRIIGKGGETIRRLMEQTGCKITIDTKAESELKSLKIIGPEDKVLQAVAKVMEIFNQN